MKQVVTMLKRPRRRIAAVAIVAVVISGIAAFSAFAQGESASITITPASPAAAPSGTATNYTITFQCSAVEADSCGANPTVTIPISLTSNYPDTPAPSTWGYAVTGSSGSLVSSYAYDAALGAIVVNLNSSAVTPGAALSLQLSVTPPNYTTPNGTSWTLAPSFQTSLISPVTASPATGQASAASNLVVTKNTADGGAFYVSGNTVTYNITASCNFSGDAGNVYLTQGSLIDALPAGLEYVSATPAPTDAPTAGGSGPITWSYGTASALPAGCSASGAGTTHYQVVATIPSGTVNNTTFANTATFSGYAIGTNPETSQPQTTTAGVTITAITSSPGGPGTGFLSKSALGPLAISNGSNPPLYAGTYVGRWLDSSNTSPSSTPGAAEGEYTVSVNYGGYSRSFQTALADPVPCMDAGTTTTGSNPSTGSGSATIYSSQPVTGPISGPGSVTPLCATPAFNPTVIAVNAASVGAAVAAGWVPTGIATSGQTFSLKTVGAPSPTAAQVHFTIPSAYVGSVAAILLPQSADLTDAQMSMNVWGYASTAVDPSGGGGQVLQNIAVATAYPTTGSQAPTTSTADASLYIEPEEPQLGVYKSFPSSSVPGGSSTTINLVGHLTVPPGGVLPAGVMITDLLPAGLTWTNSASTASFTIADSGNVTTQTVTGTLSYVQNFASTGQNLIRILIPKSAFASSGFYTITPVKTNLVTVSIPSGAGTYVNNAQLFVQKIGTNTLPECGPGTGTTASTLESSDPLNLAADGIVNQNYCQWTATLSATASGLPAFSLVKTVQGNLDSAPKTGGAISYASDDGTGTGTYGLTWTNTGGTTLTSPVIYDILPAIGDTGVSGGQSGIARGSQYAPVFTGISGTLPAGVSVQYSVLPDPCRPEVYANQTGCTNDWTTVEPSPASSVTALRFTSVKSYVSGASFQVAFTVSVPSGNTNLVAWNSAAANAESGGTELQATEPPKVGLEAVPQIPPASFTTAASTSSGPVSQVNTGTSFYDAVTVSNTGTGVDTFSYSLLGPVPVGTDGTCQTATWTSAPVVTSGSFIVAGDGLYTTPSSTPTAAGCYGYSAMLTDINGVVLDSVAAGATGETVLVVPKLSTAVTAATLATGGSVGDDVTVAGASPSAVDWQLLGPVAPNTSGTCSGVNFINASAVASGTGVPVTSGSATIPSTTLNDPGCYSFAVKLEQSSYWAPLTSAAGSTNEVVLVTPTVTTGISSASITTGNQVYDQITVQGTGNQAAAISWSLYGPVPAGNGGSCVTANWSAAPTLPVDSGTITITGDGSTDTTLTKLTAAGCYGYAATVTSPYFQVASPLGATGESVLVAPTVSTSVVSATLDSNGQASDQITVAGSGNSGTVSWTLLGPLAPGTGGSCSGLTWAGAPTAGSGSYTVGGDGTTTVGPTPLTAAGCYGYAVTLSGTAYGSDVVSAAGVSGETVLVSPTISTSVLASSIDSGNTASDTITVSGTGTQGGTIGWSLVGPVAPGNDGTCASADWSAPSTPVAQGSITVTVDGTYSTSATKLTTAGCYGYTATLEGSGYWSQAGSAVGATDETVLVNPTVTTQVTNATISTGQGASDVIAVGGTGGSGNVDWTLYGPVAPGSGGSCSGLTWTVAQKAASGSFAVSGDGTTTVGPTTLTAAGCYGYAVTLSGTAYGQDAASPVGSPGELVLVSPAVSTSVVSSAIDSGAGASDQITVTGTGGSSGNVDWTLYGPVAPGSGGSCSGLTWTAAQKAASGSFAVSGDGTTTVGPTALTAAGCYGYAVTLSGAGYGPDVESQTGAPNETVLVSPTVETTATPSAITAGDSTSDQITVAGTGGTSGTISWTLYGPVAPSGGGCGSVSWASPPVADRGTVQISADGTYTVGPTTLTAAGCYGYAATVSGASYGPDVSSPAGTSGEVVTVAAQTLSTAVSAASITAGATSTDAITVGGTGGRSGTVAWTLEGPVAAGSDGTCATADWGGAKTVAHGTIDVTADGSSTTDPAQLTTAGCYGYTATLSGPAYGPDVTSPIGATGEVVDVAPQTLSTAVASGAISGGQSSTDAITVGGTGGRPGQVAWQLQGPVSPGADGTCATATWSGAATVASGTIDVSADGVYTTPTTTLTAGGCYGYGATLSGAAYGPEVVSAVGAPNETVDVALADLTVTKRVDHGSVAAGKPLTFTIAVTNSGKGAALDVQATDTPVTKMRFVSAKPSVGTCGHGFPLVCALGTLAPGAAATVTVVAIPLEQGTVANSATVATATTTVTPPGETTATSKVIVPLTLTKVATARTVEAGSSIGFVISVANGTAVASGPVTVCDTFPRGLVFVSASIRHTLVDGSVCWALKSVSAHHTVRIRIRARALPGASGTLVNVAVLRGVGTPTRRARARVLVTPPPPKSTPVTG